MSIIKSANSTYVSPQDGTPARLDTSKSEFFDDHANRVQIHDMASSNILRQIKLWLGVNFHGAKEPHANRRRTECRRRQEALQSWGVVK